MLLVVCLRINFVEKYSVYSLSCVEFVLCKIVIKRLWIYSKDDDKIIIVVYWFIYFYCFVKKFNFIKVKKLRFLIFGILVE